METTSPSNRPAAASSSAWRMARFSRIRCLAGCHRPPLVIWASAAGPASIRSLSSCSSSCAVAYRNTEGSKPIASCVSIQSMILLFLIRSGEKKWGETVQPQQVPSQRRSAERGPATRRPKGRPCSVSQASRSWGVGGCQCHAGRPPRHPAPGEWSGSAGSGAWPAATGSGWSSGLARPDRPVSDLWRAASA